MTAQEIFTAVWNHFVVNGGDRAFSDLGCVCRGPNGSKCAMGVLLSDDEYAEIERRGYAASGVYTLVREGLLPEPLAPHRPLLSKLQSLHDDADNGDEIRKFLRAFAASNDFGVHAP